MGETTRDEAWFEAMYRRCAPAVLAYSRRRLIHPQDSEDVVLEVFTTAWRRRDDLPAPELPWLYATASNVIAHSTRAATRRTRLDARVAAQPPSTPSDPQDQVANSLDARALLGRAFGTLSEADQDILRLWAWEGLDPADLAVALDIEPAAARTRLHRAKTRLRTAITANTAQGDLA
jgi:RNA polymerase sigma-70 factor (ECF subfamily)